MALPRRSKTALISRSVPASCTQAAFQIKSGLNRPLTVGLSLVAELYTRTVMTNEMQSCLLK